MDELFSNLAIQTVQLVGKAAFGAAGTIALKRVTEYVHRMPHTAERQTEVERLRGQFEAKLRIVTPAIDLIDIISARGHSTMASVLQLTNALRKDILAFSAKLAMLDQMLDEVGDSVEDLLEKIDDAVPLLNLALTTSGAHLGSSLPTDISPSRLMQASALLSRAAAWFDVRSAGYAGPGGAIPEALVGEPFTLRLYSLFVGSVRPNSKHDFTWKEEFALCHAGLWRVMDANAAAGKADTMYANFCYELRLVEDQNDGRYHDLEQNSAGSSGSPHPTWVTDVTRHLESRDVRPGSTVRIPMENIGELHYTSSGSLLNIEDSNSPVLVISFESGRSSEDGLGISASAGTLAPEAAKTTRWFALEIANDAEPSERSDDGDSDSEDDANSDGQGSNDEALLEYIVRLAAIETSEQTSHLEIPDEKLRLYLLNVPGQSAAAAVPHSVPGGQSLRVTPYRASAFVETVTPTARNTQSPVPLSVAMHRYTPSALGSPAARNQRRLRSHSHLSASVFETPRRRPA
ncbi:Ran-binding-domain-containing protein [Coemansia reversa NRRL 1564]|uniref:Ran-binding-domain-containing protein n=1 Tax=Coemansia reversa (strain ATCC 12441 / NRRL 1564) TaxID=763665 RepID=A0A2G5BBI9_COERN|nr:Ran-binding-domain-containing protein [Coemansia reversa NRRL 1564]|eukprot:PIA16370.1 Ran-binding-domain-containing protein [Coemansia reversa NRRL 1564]